MRNLKRRFGLTLLALLSMANGTIAFASQAPNYNFEIIYERDAFGVPTTSSKPADYSAIENIRRNKDVTYFPPGYGVFSGEIPTDLTSNFHTPDANKSRTIQISDFVGIVGSEAFPGSEYMASTSLMSSSVLEYPPPSNITISYTEQYRRITSVERYGDGSIGYIEVPRFNESIKVFEGTDNAVLKKGAGHFTYTSEWHGLVGLAGHNRGSSDYFYFVKNMEIGDTISYTTKEGTRTYKVYLKERVYEDDTSHLSDTSDNVLCLITCVENVSEQRWAVLASETK